MHIAIATPALADLDALAQIYREVRRDTMNWIDPGAFRLEDFFDHTAGETLLLARSDAGDRLGFISLWDPDDFIHLLYVDRPWQGHGVGSALLLALPEWPNRCYRLKCLVKNPQAKRFYLRHGFTVVGSGASPEGAYEEMALPG